MQSLHLKARWAWLGTMLLSTYVIAGSIENTLPAHSAQGQDGEQQQSSYRLAQAAPSGGDTTGKSRMGNMPGMDHSTTSMPEKAGTSSSSSSTRSSGHGDAHGGAGAAQGGHDAHGASAAGKPGQASKATRTINVKALDTMRFDPGTYRVKAGETVRFVVTNVGKVPHEFVIGTAQEQKQHAAMMQQMPAMKHEEANAVTLDPGQTKTVVWQFSQDQTIEIACHVPGHYPAGMVSKVSIAGGNTTATKASKSGGSASMPNMDHSQQPMGK